jgi:hypothetical protein
MINSIERPPSGEVFLYLYLYETASGLSFSQCTYPVIKCGICGITTAYQRRAKRTVLPALRIHAEPVRHKTCDQESCEKDRQSQKRSPKGVFYRSVPEIAGSAFL